MEERILCAAIKRLKRKDCHNVYWEGTNDILDIEIGFRHPDILYRFVGEVSKDPFDQGFYTSKGRYVNRKEGAEIFKKSGGIVNNPPDLYSEDLY